MRYAEVGSAGVASPARYLEWFELGLAGLLREAGLQCAALEARGLALRVVETGCRFLSQIGYDDLIRIETRLDVLSPERLTFSFEVHRVDGDEEVLAAEGFAEHAVTFIGGDSGKLPADVLGALAP